MKIEAYYLDGRFEVYDTEAHFNGTNALGGGANCMTTYSVKGLSNDGLWISYSFYDVTESLSVAGHDAQCATLQRVVDVQVLDEDDFKDIAWISVDGIKRYFRLQEGEDLIDGFKFETANDIHVGSREVAAVEDKAFDLYMVLHGEDTRPASMKREEGESEDEFNARIAKRIGWPVDVLMRTIETVQARTDYMEEDGTVDDAHAVDPCFVGADDGGEIIGEAIMFDDSPSVPDALSGDPANSATPLWATPTATDGEQSEPEYDEPAPVPAYAMAAESDDDEQPEFAD